MILGLAMVGSHTNKYRPNADIPIAKRTLCTCIRRDVIDGMVWTIAWRGWMGIGRGALLMIPISSLDIKGLDVQRRIS